MVLVSLLIIWIYFDNAHQGHLKNKKYVFLSWTLSVFCLQICSTIFVVGVSRALAQSWLIPINDMDRFLVCCGLGGTLISIGLIDRVYESNDSLLLDSPKNYSKIFLWFSFDILILWKRTDASYQYYLLVDCSLFSTNYI